jgi:hypothetical protein
MEAGWRDIAAEEARSKRAALAEDEREERALAARARDKEAKRRSRKKGAAAFLDD